MPRPKPTLRPSSAAARPLRILLPRVAITPPPSQFRTIAPNVTPMSLFPQRMNTSGGESSSDGDPPGLSRDPPGPYNPYYNFSSSPITDNRRPTLGNESQQSPDTGEDADDEQEGDDGHYTAGKRRRPTTEPRRKDARTRKARNSKPALKRLGTMKPKPVVGLYRNAERQSARMSSDSVPCLARILSEQQGSSVAPFFEPMVFDAMVLDTDLAPYGSPPKTVENMILDPALADPFEATQPTLESIALDTALADPFPAPRPIPSSMSLDPARFDPNPATQPPNTWSDPRDFRFELPVTEADKAAIQEALQITRFNYQGRIGRGSSPPPTTPANESYQFQANELVLDFRRRWVLESGSSSLVPDLVTSREPWRRGFHCDKTYAGGDRWFVDNMLDGQ